MGNEFITLTSGKVNDYLHHLDVKAYGTTRMLSSFIGEFDDGSILIDCGSSLNIKNVLKYIKKNGIELSSFKYLIPSQHHFDHAGGFWKLHEELKKHNPGIQILTNKITQKLLNDFDLHLKRGMRTYGNLVGSMKVIDDDAFKIIIPDNNYGDNIKSMNIIDEFHVNNSKIGLAILKTPGHTPDHQCSVLIREGEIDFIQYGEAAGTIYHETKLVSMPTSMPIYYNHEKYMQTLDKLVKLNPFKAGFPHFGLVHGKENIKLLLKEHKEFMNEFHDKIIQYYNEKPETKYVLNKILPILLPRTDLSMEKSPVLMGIALGIVYGMLTSLGYRKIPKDELAYYNKFYSL